MDSEKQSTTKADLISIVHRNTGCSREESGRIVNSMFEIMKSVLVSGEPMKVSGFGNWSVKEKHPRRGRNPQTGEKMVIEGRRVVVFKASTVLKGEMV